MVNYFLDEFLSDFDLTKQDSRHGNTVLHLACLNQSKDLAERLFTKLPSLALKQNYQGETPIHLAIASKNFELLQIFDSVKH